MEITLGVYKMMKIEYKMNEPLQASDVSLLLLSAPSAMDYYPRIGFEKKDNAFLIPRVK